MTLHKSQEERRKEILDAARRRFVADGYSRTRLNDIAGDAELSKGGVYFHFKSKREIFDALIDQDFQRSMQALSLMRGVQGTVAEKLVFFAHTGFRAFAANPDIARFQVVMSEMALANPDVRKRLQEMHTAFVGEVEALLSSGVESGELRQDLDGDTGARLLVTIMEGLRGAIATDLNRGQELERLIERGVHLVVEGLLRR